MGPHWSMYPALAALCFLVILMTQVIDAFPRRVRDFASWDRSDLTFATSGRHKRQDDVATLIEKAFENGELFDPQEWSNNNRHRTPSRSVATGDSSGPQDAGDASLSSKRTTNGPHGQRRLFGDQQGSQSTELMQSDGKIVFPTDDDVVNHRHNFGSRPVPVCQGSTYCERATYYPEDLINQVIQQNDTYKYLAGIDVVPDIVQRIDVTDDVPLCVSTEQVVYPKSAENKRKEWLFVVNQENFKQGIRIETCSNENGDCSSVIDGLAEGYRTICKQKYIYRQLAAISNGIIAPDMFRFPSSCCCHIKFTGGALSRLGITDVGNQSPVSRGK